MREVATGIDTWSAIRHGIIPLDDRPRSRCGPLLDQGVAPRPGVAASTRISDRR